MRKLITVQSSILIHSPREVVWAFTQDFSKRQLWDQSILDFKVLAKRPEKSIWLRMKGGIQTRLIYKLCDRPNKTSLKMSETKSLLIKGGGGSWKYSEEKGMTTWVQTNSIEFKNATIFLLFGRIMKYLLLKDTQKSMGRAKLLIESQDVE